MIFIALCFKGNAKVPVSVTVCLDFENFGKKVERLEDGEYFLETRKIEKSTLFIYCITAKQVINNVRAVAQSIRKLLSKHH